MRMGYMGHALGARILDLEMKAWRPGSHLNPNASLAGDLARALRPPNASTHADCHKLQQALWWSFMIGAYFVGRRFRTNKPRQPRCGKHFHGRGRHSGVQSLVAPHSISCTLRVQHQDSTYSEPTCTWVKPAHLGLQIARKDGPISQTKEHRQYSSKTMDSTLPRISYSAILGHSIGHVGGPGRNNNETLIWKKLTGIPSTPQMRYTLYTKNPKPKAT